MALVDSRGYQLVPDAGNALSGGLQIGNQVRGMRYQKEDRALAADERAKKDAFEKSAAEKSATGDELMMKIVSGLDRSDPVISQLAALDPVKFEQAYKSMGMIDESKIREAADFAFNLQNTQPEMRSAKIQARAQELASTGRNPSDTLELMQMSPDEQDFAFKFMQIAALPAQERAKLLIPGKQPEPKIMEGVGPDGKPGVFAVSPQGASVIPGITPAPKTPLVSNTISNGGGSDVAEEQKAIAKMQGGRFSAVMDAGDTARSTIESLDQLDAIDVKTGALEPSKVALAAVMNGFGVDSSWLANVTSAQALEAGSNRMVNDILNAAKGPQTEGDANRAKTIIRSLGNDPKAGQFKSDALRALSLRKIEQADFVGNMINNGKTFTAADQAWSKYKNSTPSLSAVIKNPQTGLPLFYYQFKENAKRVREGITDDEIAAAWRRANAKR